MVTLIVSFMMHSEHIISPLVTFNLFSLGVLCFLISSDPWRLSWDSQHDYGFDDLQLNTTVMEMRPDTVFPTESCRANITDLRSRRLERHWAPLPDLW